MFKKFIVFEVSKADTNKVIDTLSRYKTGLMHGISDLSIVNESTEEYPYYTVSLHCRSTDVENCLNDILSLTRNGVVITGLIVG